LVLALGLNPLIAGLERYRIDRWASALIVFLLLAAGVAGIIYLLLPTIRVEVRMFEDEFGLYRARALQRLGFVFFRVDDFLRLHTDITLAKALDAAAAPLRAYAASVLTELPAFLTGL